MFAMIVTVTLNPALDKTIVVPGFAVGATNRARVERIDLGGKGINVARAARRLGCEVLATGFLGTALTVEDLPNHFVQVPAETRVNLKIKDPLAGTETEINEPGFRVERADLEQLEGRIRQHAAPGVVMVFSGSLPPGAPSSIYADYLRIARERGAGTILDTGGEALREGVRACPDLVKPNRVEAEELLGVRIADEDELLRAGRMLLALGPRAAVISLGASGALGMSAEKCCRARAPAVKPASSVAAGDAMVAALAYAMLEHLPLENAVPLAVAAGTATVAMPGSEVAGRDSIEKLLPEVEVRLL